MSAYWVDANILLRLITNDPPDLAERAARLANRAEQGEITLKVTSIVVAEVVWVLTQHGGTPGSQALAILLPLPIPAD